MRRWLALVVASAGLLAGCGGSTAPFFVVRNDRPADLFVIYCATQTCTHRQERLVRTGKAWRVTNLTGVHDVGLLSVSLGGRQEGCVPVPPALAMVDRLFVFTTSSLRGAGCPGYNPQRLLGIKRRANQ